MWRDEGGGYTNAEKAGDIVDVYAEYIDLIRGFRDQRASAPSFTRSSPTWKPRSTAC